MMNVWDFKRRLVQRMHRFSVQPIPSEFGAISYTSRHGIISKRNNRSQSAISLGDGDNAGGLLTSTPGFSFVPTLRATRPLEPAESTTPPMIWYVVDGIASTPAAVKASWSRYARSVDASYTPFASAAALCRQVRRWSWPLTPEHRYPE